MDFFERKQKSIYPKADSRNPWMGLDGKVCEDPIYWCRLHEVWLSEEDTSRKKCLSRLSANMMETRVCNCIERKSNNPFLYNKEEK